MSGVSSTRLRVKTIDHVTLVVKDLEKFNERDIKFLNRKVSG